MNANEIKPAEAYRIMLKKYPDVLNIKQMCEIFGISQKTGYKMLQENKIPFFQSGQVVSNPEGTINTLYQCEGYIIHPILNSVNSR